MDMRFSGLPETCDAFCKGSLDIRREVGICSLAEVEMENANSLGFSIACAEASFSIVLIPLYSTTFSGFQTPFFRKS